MTQYPVFDVHTHVYPEKIAARAVENLGNFYEIDVEGRGTYEDLEASAAPCGVRGFLLFNVATNARQVPKVNDAVAEAVRISRAHGFLTAGFAGMHQEYPDPVGELDRAVSMGLCGVKIHPDIQGADIDDPRFFPLYGELEKRGLPLCLHMGDPRPEYAFSKAEKLVHMLSLFPDLRVLAAHLGGYCAWDAACSLADNPRIFFDTSSALWVLPPEQASELIRRLGVHRVMFGTDYPVRYVRGELERFFALPGFTETERKAMLYDNAIHFLGL